MNSNLWLLNRIAPTGYEDAVIEISSPSTECVCFT